MIKQGKKFIRGIITKINIGIAYINDYKEYSKWQYNNPRVNTKNALEARILRQTHEIE